MDLDNYIDTREGCLQEHEAEVSVWRDFTSCPSPILMEHVVDAAKDNHSEGVFQQDVKLYNVLVETGSDLARVQVTDFGCGCILNEDCNTRGLRLFSLLPVGEVILLKG